MLASTKRSKWSVRLTLRVGIDGTSDWLSEILCELAKIGNPTPDLDLSQQRRCPLPNQPRGEDDNRRKPYSAASAWLTSGTQRSTGLRAAPVSSNRRRGVILGAPRKCSASPERARSARPRMT